MRTILILIRKEFLQIFRDTTIIRMIIVLPLLQLIVFINAANMIMKNIHVYVVDNDMSQTSRQLLSKFEGSPYFKITDYSFSIEDGTNALKTNKADIVLNIPVSFEKRLQKENKGEIQLLVNAINSTSAELINSYTTSIISDFNRNILPVTKLTPEYTLKPNVNIQYSYWFNSTLSYKLFFLPAMITVIMTMIAMVLCALNLVKEKEIGTIEQINVTPIKKYQFIIGKLIPFWVLALLEIPFELLLAKVLYNISYDGNLPFLFFLSGIYLFCVMGIALYVSTTANTQQQVALITFFFLLVFIMMSGLFTPTESMPGWAKILNILNPVAYFIKAIRMILLKSSSFWDLTKEVVCLSVYAISILSLAVWRYRKTT